jgi:hypothetical protein
MSIASRAPIFRRAPISAPRKSRNPQQLLGIREKSGSRGVEALKESYHDSMAKALFHNC